MGRTYSQEYKVKIARDITTNKIVAEFWYNDQGKLDRDDLPALIKYDSETGNVIEAAWYKNGQIHKEGEPAHLWYDPNTGIITQEAWFLKGKLHRENDEPALISRDATTGEVLDREYWRYSRKISEETNIPDGPT